MEGMEEKLGAILSNPQMMEKIMGLAQSLGQDGQNPNPPPLPMQERAPTPPGIDPAALHTLSSFVGNNAIDPQQKALLQALTPYVSRDRVTKLENAMRAAKLARLASRFLGNGGLQLLTGR